MLFSNRILLFILKNFDHFTHFKVFSILNPGFHVIVSKAWFPCNRFCRKDRLCRFKFVEATETIEATEAIIWKRSSQTTEAILAIETILAYGSSEIDSSSISDDPYAGIVSIARIAFCRLRRVFPYNRLCRF